MIEHAIQLQFVAVKELHMETFWPIPNPNGYNPDEGFLQFSASPLDPDTQSLQVRLRFITGQPSPPAEEEVEKMKAENKQPFHLRAEIVGEFHVDLAKFPIENVHRWAKTNAPLILLPFLREHVFALSSRSGSAPLVLPMMLVPTIVKESADAPERKIAPRFFGGGAERNGVVPVLRQFETTT